MFLFELLKCWAVSKEVVMGTLSLGGIECQTMAQHWGGCGGGVGDGG